MLLAPSHQRRQWLQRAQRGYRTRPSNKHFVVVEAMPSVLSRADAAAPVIASAQAPCARADQLSISTPEAAALMGFSEATLRNYVWLNSLSSEERVVRKLQVPPAGLPVPTRKRGRLLWSRTEVLKFAEQKSKSTE